MDILENLLRNVNNPNPSVLLIREAADEIRRLRFAATHSKLDAAVAVRYLNEHKCLPISIECLRTLRAYIEDCIETGHDKGSIGNLMSARDEIDRVLTGSDDNGGRIKPLGADDAEFGMKP